MLVYWTLKDRTFKGFVKTLQETETITKKNPPNREFRRNHQIKTYRIEKGYVSSMENRPMKVQRICKNCSHQKEFVKTLEVIKFNCATHSFEVRISIIEI